MYFKDFYSKQSEIFYYCLDRILRYYELWNKYNYEISTRKGYYGDEIDEITFNEFDLVVSSINKILSLDDINKIYYVLNLEYGYLLDEIKNKQVEITKILKSDVIFNNEYKKGIKYIPYIFIKNLPIGLYLYKNNKYRLIDGYHRFVNIKDYKFKGVVLK